MTHKSVLKGSSALLLAGAIVMPTAGAFAQDQDNALLEEIIVTATKKAGGVNIKDAPVAMTAFGETQLDALHARDLQSLSYSSPNVQLEDIGTAKGVANFSIRGLGINSSIPSIDPTVGVFVDGMYLGVISGVIFDTFDLESVEVLRGPQGILFGRNVTGGAVLMNTKKPTDTLEINAKTALETGTNFIAAGTITGPLTENGKVKGKAAIYYNHDKGYFTNLATNAQFGRSTTFIFRPALTFEFSERLESTIRYEFGKHDGQGPASKNNGLFARDTFEFAIDEEGDADNKWEQLIWETNLDVDFGDGTVTNIAAWRKFSGVGRSDIDAMPAFLFHAEFGTEQDQFSNELRYSGSFGDVDVTSGLYYFGQDIDYLEHRLIVGGAVDLTGGGIQDQTTWGAFTQFDYHLNDEVTFNVGGRYSSEEKDVTIQTLIPTGLACTIDDGCSSFDFVHGDKWTSFSPKVGVQWAANEDTNFYGFWTIGYRSGGYNFRNTSPTALPGPFDQEKQSSFEIGMKADFLENRARVNVALFHNTITDMQREVNLADPFAGVVQIIQNTADAKIKGFEADIQFVITENVTLTGQVGYVDGDYKTVLFDISGDGVVDAGDLALEIPRLAPWTYGAGLFLNLDTEIGALSGHAIFNHRDMSFYTDNNNGFLQGADMVDLNISLAIGDSGFAVSVFGKNVLNEATIGGDTQLPFFPGATFSPLNKGRVWGVEMTFKM